MKKRAVVNKTILITFIFLIVLSGFLYFSNLISSNLGVSGKVIETQQFNIQSVEIDSCQTLGPGTYVLNQSIVSGDPSSCFYINGDNIILDGNGYTISGSRGGIFSNGYNNLTVRNLIIDGVGDYGIDFQFTDNNTITNVSIYSTEFDGISLYNSDYNNFTNVVSSNASDGNGIIGDASHHNLFVNFTTEYNSASGINLPSGQVLSNIESRFNNGDGIVSVGTSELDNLRVSSNLNRGLVLSPFTGTVRDSNISGNANEDIRVSSFLADLINVSYSIDRENVDPSTQLIREWYATVNIIDQNSNPLQGVTLNFFNSSSSLSASNSTNSNGIAKQPLAQYFDDANVIAYLGNYTIIASKSGYVGNSTSVNMSGNKDITLTLVRIGSQGNNGGGGGGGGGTVNPNAISLFSLKIIVPKPLAVRKNDNLVIPLTIFNDGQLALSDISFTSKVTKDDSATSDISAVLDKNKITSLTSGQKENLTLNLIANEQTQGDYAVEIFADVKNPIYQDSAKLYLSTSESGELSNRLVFVEDLIANNPKCAELRENYEEAKRLIENNQISKAEREIENIITSCRELITTDSDQEVGGNNSNLAGYIALGALTVFLVGFLIYFFKHKDARNELTNSKTL